MPSKVKQHFPLNILEKKTVKLSNMNLYNIYEISLSGILTVANGILTGFTDQGNTWVTIFYKFILILKKNHT